MVGLSDQEILNILRKNKTNFEQVKEAKQSELRQKKMDLFRNPSSIQIQKDIVRLEKQIANLDFYLNHANSQIAKFESKLNSNLQEETRPKQKTEAQTSYQPKEEPNNKNQKPESKKDLSLKDYAKQQGYESDQKEVDLLLKDAEQDLKNRQEKEKHRERIQNQIERDILLSIVNDQKDVLTYLNLIDETYSSKNNSVIGVLENLKRKQGKRNPVFDKKAPKNTLDIFGGPKYKARESTQPNIITRPDSFEDEVKKLKDNINKPIKLLRQTDQIDQSAPKIKTVQVAYEDSTRPNGKKIPVLKIEET